MERHGDIYKAPDARPKDGGAGHVVDVRPAALRARTRRNTVAVTALMAVLLALAWWFVYTQEERDRQRRDQVAALTEEFGLLPDRAPDAPSPVLAAPELADLNEPFTPPPGASGLTDLDREKIAQAMGQARIADQYLRARDWDAAEQHARQALEVWPNMAVAERLLGFVYIQRAQYDQAIAILQHALESDSFNPEIFNNLGSAYMHKWESAKAEEAFNTALRILPDYAVAHINLGLLYVVVGRYDLAIDQLQRALEMVPDNPSPRNNLAVALIRVGRYEEARRHLQYIIDRIPQRASAYFNTAISFVMEREYDQAMAWIRRGADRCTPVMCRTYLADSDFDPIRGHPAFQALVKNLYPELPALPEG